MKKYRLTLPYRYDIARQLSTAILASMEEFKMCRWTNEEGSLSPAYVCVGCMLSPIIQTR
jgi:hypothetical protein